MTRMVTAVILAVLSLSTLVAAPSAAAEPTSSAAAEATAAPTAEPPASPTSSPSAEPTVAPPAAGQPAACGWNDFLTLNPAADVMAGRVTIGGFAPVGIGATADVDWTQNPYRNSTWTLFFRSAKWAESLVTGFRATGDTALLDRAVGIAKDVVRDNPDPGSNVGSWNDHATSLRTSFLVCLWETAPAERTWLEPAIATHTAALMNRSLSISNHGTMQQVALLGAGCALGRRAWIDRATGRLATLATHQLDAEGVSDEQSTAYAGFMWRLWSDVRDEAAHCGIVTPPGYPGRLAASDLFMAHATAPDGTLVPIGDSWPVPPQFVVGPQARYAVTRGASGTAPSSTFARFAAGYAFGRTSWTGSDGHQWSVRYGPGLYGHGHNDHLGVTYYSRGRRVLVDSGFDGYDDKAYRNWSLTPEAHNVPVLPGTAFDPSAATTLRTMSGGPVTRVLQFADRAYARTSRGRTVLVDDTLQAMIIRDDVVTDRARRVRMLWHLDPSWRLEGVRTTTGLSTATFTSPDRTLRAGVVQAGEPGKPLPRSASHLVRGQTSPVQGWIGLGNGKRAQNWVVEGQRYDRTVRSVTAVVVAPVGQTVAFTRVQTSPGRDRLVLAWARSGARTPPRGRA
ncbi:MAG: hypothetical protein JWN54_2867 [Mycobacterium sp.]|nr:hypothetical protein [Mycobacterium sp.]